MNKPVKKNKKPTREEKMKNYMKLTKADLAIMLIDAHWCIALIASAHKKLKNKTP